jgi:hypothetical protein
MGDIRSHEPVLLILAAFSRHPSAIEWGRERANREWGPIVLTSDPFDFVETKFYETTMGQGIQKIFFAFERLIDPAQLVELKHLTNAWEVEFRDLGTTGEERPLNLDPGYLTEAKFVLATTKDREHRLYLDRGIFAEVTLAFQAHQWQARPWTYPDYRRSDYHHFFTRCRDYLRQRYGKKLPRSRNE